MNTFIIYHKRYKTLLLIYPIIIHIKIRLFSDLLSDIFTLILLKFVVYIINHIFYLKLPIYFIVILYIFRECFVDSPKLEISKDGVAGFHVDLVSCYGEIIKGSSLFPVGDERMSKQRY